MASQTITLGLPNSATNEIVGWNPTSSNDNNFGPIETSFIDGGLSAYISLLQIQPGLSSGSLTLHLRLEATGGGFAAGPEFTPTFEATGRIIIAAGSATLTLVGTGADTAEPYNWTPTNSADVTAFVNAYVLPTSATITFTDAPPALNIGGGAISFDALAIEGGTVEIIPPVIPLTLDDWTTPTGYVAEVLMLVTHGSGDAYQAGSSGSISAGSDAALDNADITINRIRIISSGALIRLNHSGAGAWNANFGAGLPYEDAIAYVQIGDTPIALTLGPRNVANIRFNVPSASQAALNALGQGDLFILAITVPETVEVTNLNVSGGDLDLGEIAATGGTVTIVPPTPLNISGGAVTFGALTVEGGVVEVAQPATPLNVSGGAITFGALAVEGGTVRVFIPPPTISQTIILGGFSGGGWSGAVLLNSGLIEGGAVAYLRRVYTSGSSPRVEIASSATASPADLGPEFTDGVETWSEAFLFDADGSTVTLKGPNHPDNSFSDPSEPYFWTPDNSAAWRAWFLAAPAATLVTVTITGPSLAIPLNISGGELDFGSLAGHWRHGRGHRPHTAD